MLSDSPAMDATHLASDPAARCRAALQCLAEAHWYARDAQCEIWEFAVDWNELSATGLAPRDLRWLLKKGYIARAREVTAAPAVVRHIEPAGPTFGHDDCFVVTDAGLAVLRASGVGATQPDAPAIFAINRVSSVEDRAGLRPHWDAQRRTLAVGDTLVKRYRQPSSVQELILAAFEEEGWPARVADPLPRRGDQEPKRRLHDAIRALNQHQAASLIRFGGDGTGEGVLWELTEAAAVDEPPVRLRVAA